MVMNSSISRCLKSDFKAFEKKDNNQYMIAWGKQNEVERVTERNEKTGELTFTGEVLETDYCTFRSGLYTGILTPYLLQANMLEGTDRHASVHELHEIYNGIGVSEEQQMSYLSEALLAEIRRYDKSKAVEDFSIGGVHLWLNSDMRNKVRENLETAQQKGEGDVILRYEGMAFPMSVQMGWQLYYAVLDYARATWDVTEIHLATASKLTTVEEILAYDYTQGYPEKLAF